MPFPQFPPMTTSQVNIVQYQNQETDVCTMDIIL